MQDNNDMFKRPENQENNSLDEQFKTRVFSKPVDDEDKTDYSVSDKTVEDIFSTDKSKKEQPKKLKEKKQRKALPTIVKVLILFGISIALAAVIILTAIEIFGISFKNSATVEIYIKPNFSTRQIASELKRNGIIDFEFLFRAYSKFKGADGQYKFGMYELKSSQSYDSIISELQEPGQSGDIVTVTIPEGYSVRKIAALMQEKGVCTQEEFIKAVKNNELDYDFVKEIPTEKVYYKLEGYLYPDTYQFFVNSDGDSGQECADRAVKKMVDRMSEMITDDVKETAKMRGYTVHEVLTMASVVELEASGYPKDMKKVAQVFYNRLRWTDQPAKLGSTPTQDYPDSRYDTNKNEGLPPGPLCSPSKVAIDAALNPDTSVKEDFFVTDKNMKFYYTSSYDEHKELIERLESEGLWD